MHDPYCIYGMNISLVTQKFSFHFEKALRGCVTKPLQRREKLNFKYKHYNNI